LVFLREQIIQLGVMPKQQIKNQLTFITQLLYLIEILSQIINESEWGLYV